MRLGMTKTDLFQGFLSNSGAMHVATKLCGGFPLSLRIVEDPLSEPGLDVSHETVLR